MTNHNDFLPIGDHSRPQLHVVTLGSLDDSGPQQLGAGTGFAGQQIGEAVRRQSFGVTSNPPAGAEGLFLSSGGRSDRGHMLGLEHPQYRVTGNPTGTTVIYDSSGNAIRVYTKDGIQIEAKSGDIYVKPAQGKMLYHGGRPGDGGTYLPVMLANGAPSSNVYAKV